MNVEAERVVVQRLLRGGMALSTLLFLAGLLAASSQGGITPRGVRLLAISSTARSGDVGEAVAAVAVLVLAATPVARVLALVDRWARERDFRFMGISLVVAAILGCAILGVTGVWAP